MVERAADTETADAADDAATAAGGDPRFVARLLLGALSGHEQRRLAVRLVERDAEVRATVATALAAFRMGDEDLARAYDEAVARGAGEEARAELLARSRVRAPDVEEEVRRFTYEDVFALGGTTRRLFTWSTAEHLLARSDRPGTTGYEARTSLHLALLVIDVVELLGAVDRAPRLPALVADVRRRIDAAAAVVAAGPPAAEGPG